MKRIVPTIVKRFIIKPVMIINRDTSKFIRDFEFSKSIIASARFRATLLTKAAEADLAAKVDEWIVKVLRVSRLFLQWTCASFYSGINIIFADRTESDK